MCIIVGWLSQAFPAPSPFFSHGHFLQYNPCKFNFILMSVSWRTLTNTWSNTWWSIKLNEKLFSLFFSIKSAKSRLCELLNFEKLESLVFWKRVYWEGNCLWLHWQMLYNRRDSEIMRAYILRLSPTTKSQPDSPLHTPLRWSGSRWPYQWIMRYP